MRQVAMDFLSSSKEIECHFDVTNQMGYYYSQTKSVKTLLEDRFIENMSKSDYSLCVRATGNYSARFYQALIAGRIPVVVDTDRVLPFEEHVHVIRVPVNEIHRISDFVLNHFESTSDKQFIEMKRSNRDAYNRFMMPEKFIPSFIKKVLEDVER
jgi:hypothetical protein